MISSTTGRLPKVSELKALLSKAQPSDFVTNTRSLARITHPSVDEIAALNARIARDKERDAQYKARLAEVEASNDLEQLDIYLPDVADLDLDMAKKVKANVEVDIEQGAGNGKLVHSFYEGQEIRSMGEYLSRLTRYIADKSASSARTPSAPDASSPAAGPSQTQAPPITSAATSGETAASEPVSDADPDWTDPVGRPGQNHIRFPNVASLTREMAAAVYKQVDTMVRYRDISDSVIHARNGLAGTNSVETYMKWLAKRAAINIVA